MLKEWIPAEIPEKEELEMQLDRDRDKLYGQLQVREVPLER